MTCGRGRAGVPLLLLFVSATFLLARVVNGLPSSYLNKPCALDTIDEPDLCFHDAGTARIARSTERV